MANKVLIFTIFILCISCNSQESKSPHAQQSTAVAPKSSGKKLSYERQLVELYDIFRIAQSAAVPQETLDAVISKITDDKLYLVRDFVIEYTKRTPGLISDKFLSKPDRATLESVYYLYMTGVDAFANGAADALGVINKGIPADISTRDLLVNYYKVLFMRMHRVTSVNDYSNYSMDFDKLSLKSAEEKAILFYMSMSYFGVKYSNNARRGCRNAKAFFDAMPSFDGKKFFEYSIPNFDPFKVYYSEAQGKKFFREAYGQSYKAGMAAYQKCR
jgi:hypothetical protein